MTTAIINGEYAHHRCDHCGKKERGTPWTTHGPGFSPASTWSQDSSIAPAGWGHEIVPFGKSSSTRHDLCPDCIVTRQKAKASPPSSR